MGQPRSDQRQWQGASPALQGFFAAGLNRYLLMNLHSALAENLLPNPSDEGRIRQHALDIGQSVYRPLSTPQQIDETLEVLLRKLNAIADPFG